MDPYTNMSEYVLYIFLILISIEVHTDESLLSSVPFLISGKDETLQGKWAFKECQPSWSSLHCQGRRKRRHFYWRQIRLVSVECVAYMLT